MKPNHQKTTTTNVDWLLDAGLDDCKRTAARAPLWALVEAHRILKTRQQAKTRLAVVAAAMKRRFGIMAGSDAALVKKAKR